MTVASLMPNVIPTSTSYGPDLTDSSPVKEQTKELASANWNQLKADVAYIAGKSPAFSSAKLYVDANGVVQDAAGISIGHVTVEHSATGTYTVTISSDAGLSSIRFIGLTVLTDDTGHFYTGAVMRTDTLILDVRIRDGVSAIDSGFFLDLT